MTAFARWIGFMAAAGAALLAAVWLLQAMPPSEETRRFMQSECSAAASNEASRAYARRDTLAAELARAQSLTCHRVGLAWDDNLTTRGLLAAGGAVALLLLAAMVPADAPREAREGAERERALDLVIADEKRRALAEHGTAINDLEARIRAQKRLRDSGHG